MFAFAMAANLHNKTPMICSYSLSILPLSFLRRRQGELKRFPYLPLFMVVLEIVIMLNYTMSYGALRKIYHSYCQPGATNDFYPLHTDQIRCKSIED